MSQPYDPDDDPFSAPSTSASTSSSPTLFSPATPLRPEPSVTATPYRLLGKITQSIGLGLWSPVQTTSPAQSQSDAMEACERACNERCERLEVHMSDKLRAFEERLSALIEREGSAREVREGMEKTAGELKELKAVTSNLDGSCLELANWRTRIDPKAAAHAKRIQQFSEMLGLDDKPDDASKDRGSFMRRVADLEKQLEQTGKEVSHERSSASRARQDLQAQVDRAEEERDKIREAFTTLAQEVANHREQVSAELHEAAEAHAKLEARAASAESQLKKADEHFAKERDAVKQHLSTTDSQLHALAIQMSDTRDADAMPSSIEELQVSIESLRANFAKTLEVNAEVATHRSQLADLTSRVDDKQGSHDSLRNRLDKAEYGISQLGRDLAERNSEWKNEANRLEQDKNSRIADARNDLAAVKVSAEGVRLQIVDTMQDLTQAVESMDARVGLVEQKVAATSQPTHSDASVDASMASVPDTLPAEQVEPEVRNIEPTLTECEEEVDGLVEEKIGDVSQETPSCVSVVDSQLAEKVEVQNVEAMLPRSEEGLDPITTEEPTLDSPPTEQLEVLDTESPSPSLAVVEDAHPTAREAPVENAPTIEGRITDAALNLTQMVDTMDASIELVEEKVEYASEQAHDDVSGAFVCNSPPAEQVELDGRSINATEANTEDADATIAEDGATGEDETEQEAEETDEVESGEETDLTTSEDESPDAGGDTDSNPDAEAKLGASEAWTVVEEVEVTIEQAAAPDTKAATLAETQIEEGVNARPGDVRVEEEPEALAAEAHNDIDDANVTAAQDVEVERPEAADVEIGCDTVTEEVDAENEATTEMKAAAEVKSVDDVPEQAGSGTEAEKAIKEVGARVDEDIRTKSAEAEPELAEEVEVETRPAERVMEMRPAEQAEVRAIQEVDEVNNEVVRGNTNEDSAGEQSTVTAGEVAGEVDVATDGENEVPTEFEAEAETEHAAIEDEKEEVPRDMSQELEALITRDVQEEPVRLLHGGSVERVIERCAYLYI